MNELKERIARLRQAIAENSDEVAQNLEDNINTISLYSKENAYEIMDNPENWVFVHATNYEPKNNEKGEMYIPPTAMVTDNDLPRASVHGKLNAVVGANSAGSWDKAPFVVLAPYNDVVRLNGNPQEVSVDDTYFIPDPDTGLLLPKNAYLIKPDPNADKLINFDEHGEHGYHVVTYKTDNYTDKEIEEILALSEGDRYLYEKYMNGDASDFQINHLLGYDKKLMAAYDKSENKKLFLRGLLEEDRFAILNKLLRDAAVKMGLEKMGYHYVYSHEDRISENVANIARENGIRGCSSDKGHSLSLEHLLENSGYDLLDLVNVLKSKDSDEIFKTLTTSEDKIYKDIALNITEGKPLPDFFTIHQKSVDTYLTLMSIQASHDAKHKDEYSACADKIKKGGIKAFNANLYITLHRQSEKMKAQAEQAIGELKKNPEEFAKLQKRLRDNFNAGGLNLYYTKSQER